MPRAVLLSHGCTSARDRWSSPGSFTSRRISWPSGFHPIPGSSKRCGVKPPMIAATLALLLLVQDPEAPRTGSYSTSFKERHPLSDVKELAKRQGWKLDEVRKKEPEFEKRKI